MRLENQIFDHLVNGIRINKLSYIQRRTVVEKG